MKKKIFVIIFIMILSLLTTGCDANEEEMKAIVKQFQKQKILNSNLELIETISYKDYGIIPHSNTLYIYKDSNQQLISMQCERSYNDEYDYRCKLASDLSLNENVEYISKEEREKSYNNTGYYYEDGSYSKQNKYLHSTYDAYLVTVSKTIFDIKIYTIQLED